MNQKNDQAPGTEKTFEFFFENIADGVIIAGAETKRFSMCNRAICLMLDYTKEELLNISIYNIHPKETLPRIEELFDKLINKEIELAKEVPILRKDGRVFYCNITALPIQYNDKPHLLGIFRNVTERKEMEDTLRLNEAQLSNSIKLAKLAYWEYNLAEDIVTLNDYFYSIFHTSAGQVGGYTMQSARFMKLFIYPDDIFAVMDKMRNAVKADDSSPGDQFEHRFIHNDGKIGYISERHFVVKDSQGLPIKVYGVMQDITERKLAEEVLKESENRFRSIIENSKDGIIFFDGENQKILFGNDSMAELLKCSKEDLTGRSISSLHPPEEWKSIEQEFLKHVHGEILVSTEIPVIRKDGSVRYADISSSHMILDGRSYFAAFFRDITERRQAEKKFKQLANLHQTILDSVPVGIAYIKNLRFQWTNKAYARIFGLDSADIIGLEPSFFYNNEDYEKVKNEAYTQFPEGKTYHDEIQGKTKDGRLYTHSMIGKAINPADLSEGSIWIAMDITEQKKIEAEKSRLEEMLLRSQKMEAIGTMAGGIVHDFNNILSGIFGYSELSLSVKDNPPDTNRYIREILNAAERARDLISRILTFSRQTEPALKPIIPKYIIEEALKLLRASTPAALNLKAILNSDSAVMADSTLLHQVILNLCNNALHATQSRPGVIEVSLEDMEADQEFARLHPGIKPGKHIIIRVSDTGCGIAPEILDHIFEPFFTTKAQGEGTGLGLSVVHGIVEKLKGIITVYSEIGKGTVFNIIIPAVDNKEVEIDRSDSLIKGGTEKILIVDDEESIIITLKQILHNLGYKVKAFTDCRKAIREFEKNPGGYDVIILDYSMPHMTGLEMARKIKEIRNDIPIILSSGYLNNQMGETASEAGISEILSKPVSTYKLADAVRRAISGIKA